MKIVSVSQTQTFTYIPRVFANGTLTYSVTDEQTNKTQSITASTSTDDNYLTATMTFGSDNAPFREGHFYTLEVLNGSDLIYRDKVFCTNQTTQQSTYNVNKDVYETNDTHDNDYIVL
jgi:hypothetical protein